MEMVADKCERCGKIVVKQYLGDSSDMVRTRGLFLYLCDVKDNATCRPSLLKDYTSEIYCLDCLDATVHEWVEELKKRGKSDIPLNHILLPDRVDKASKA